jgi:hypothetical protein
LIMKKNFKNMLIKENTLLNFWYNIYLFDGKQILVI